MKGNFDGRRLKETYVDFQDTFRMSGAKALRQLFLFEKCVLICKKKEDGNLVAKSHIMVRNRFVLSF